VRVNGKRKELGKYLKGRERRELEKLGKFGE